MTPFFPEIRRRLEARTPGDWHRRTGLPEAYKQNRITIKAAGGNTVCALYGDKATDAELIAHSPTDLETLLKALDLCVEALEWGAEFTGYPYAPLRALSEFCRDAIAQVKALEVRG